LDVVGALSLNRAQAHGGRAKKQVVDQELKEKTRTCPLVALGKIDPDYEVATRGRPSEEPPSPGFTTHISPAALSICDPFIHLVKQVFL
jgi:hypothetical protein